MNKQLKMRLIELKWLCMHQGKAVYATWSDARRVLRYSRNWHKLDIYRCSFDDDGRLGAVVHWHLGSSRRAIFGTDAKRRREVLDQ